MSQGPLIRIAIENFKGVASFEAEPNGSSFELRGTNGAGKSSTIDALCWALGFNPPEEVVRNGEAEARTEVTIGDYIVTRVKKRDADRASLRIKAAETGTPLGSSPSLLRGFLDAIERNTFSRRKPAEQADVLRKLCPGIDTTALDAEYARRFAERTDVNREAKALAVQADGVKIPQAPAEVPADIDLADIAAKKTEVERQKAENAKAIEQHQRNQNIVKARQDEIADLRRQLADAEASLRAAVQQLESSAKLVDSIKPIDTKAIDDEIAKARAINTERAQQRRTLALADAAREQKDRLTAQAKQKQRASERITERLDAIVQEKAKQLAAAKLPIDGLAIADDAVTLCGVELAALDNYPRMSLDVRIAAAQGHRLVVVRDAILLTAANRAELEREAQALGVQLVCEVVTEGGELHAEIVEAGA